VATRSGEVPLVVDRRSFLFGASRAAMALGLGGSWLAGSEALARSAVSVGSLLSRVQRYAAGEVHESGVGGPTSVAWAVVGETRRAGATGARSVNGSPAGEDTLVEIGSVTKVFTALLLAETLLRKPELSLQTRIGRYLPPGITNLRLNALTLEEMATYSACIVREPRLARPATRAELAAFLNGPRAFRPGLTSGVDYFYSNLEFDLLGDIVGSIWKTRWETLLEEFVTGPLAMHDTVRSPSVAQSLRLATGYHRKGRVAKPLTVPPFLGASKILRSTSADMLRFLEAQIDPASAPGTLRKSIRLTQRLLFRPRNAVARLGLGWFLHITPQQTVLSKNGGVAGFTSFIGFAPLSHGLFLAENSTSGNPTTGGRRLLGIGTSTGDEA
jgi:CubicO group peptidase (beta-lactamase class C family)